MNIIPQLAETMKVQDLPKYATNDRWCFEQKCLSATTPILTETGWQPVRYVKAGQQVIGSDGNSHRISKVHRRAARGDSLVTLRPYSGLDVEVTPDHRVLTPNGWVEAQNLAAGDFVCIPRPSLVGPILKQIDLVTGASYKKTIEIDNDFLWLCGLWVGDGSADKGNNDKTRGRISFAINRRDASVVARVSEILESLGATPQLHNPGDRAMTHVYTTDGPLSNWLNQNFRRHGPDHIRAAADSKTIPSWFDGLTDDQFGAFCEGWKTADGRFDRTLSDSVATVSSNLSGLMYRQFLARGIPVSIKRYPSTWTYKGETKTGLYYQFIFLRSTRMVRVESDRWLLRLKATSTRPIPDGTVLYDLTVEDIHDFAAGFTLHNCDGHRKLVVVENGKVSIIGRGGQDTDLACRDVFERFPGTWAFDGEVLPDGTFWIFDLPVAGEKIGLKTPYRLRRQVLDGLKDALECDEVRILPCARTTAEKVTLAKQVITSGAEGVMVKDMDAPYASGKRTKANLKAKMVKDLDAFITRFGIGVSSNGSGSPKQNVGLGVYDTNGKVREIATCIIHPKEQNQVRAYNDNRPEVAHLTPVATVAYLYAVDPNKPRLVQPTRLRPRQDKTPHECTIDQIQFTDKSVLIGSKA